MIFDTLLPDIHASLQIFEGARCKMNMRYLKLLSDILLPKTRRTYHRFLRNIGQRQRKYLSPRFRPGGAASSVYCPN